MLYVSAHPERVEGMFMQSPACAEDQDREGWVYDPYNLRITDAEDVNVPKKEVD